MEFPKLYAIVDRETLDRRGVAVRTFAEELVEGGVRLVQYRDKVSGAQEILRACGEIASVFEGVDACLILNDRADLAALLGWGCHVGQGDLGVGDVRRVVGLGEGFKRGGRGGFAEVAVGLTALTPHPSRSEERDEWGTRVVGVSTHSVEEMVQADGLLGGPGMGGSGRANRAMPTSQNRDMGHPDFAGSSWGSNYLAVGPVFRTSTKLDAEAVVGLEGVRMARGLTWRPVVAIGGIGLGNFRSVLAAGADSVAVISGLFVEGRRVREVAREFLADLG